MPETPSFAVPAPDDTLLRGRLLWLVAAPAGAAALLFAVTAGYLWAGGADRSDLVLIVAFLIGVVVLTVTAGQAVGTIRRLDDRPAQLRADVAEARAQTALARADLADGRAEATAALTEAAGYRTALADARAEIEALSERVRLAEERPVPVRTSAGRQVEVFVNLSRRLQSLVHREIKLLDALENEVEDPDLLKGLFQVDHLATRIRRHAENLAVLGGAVSRRQWSRPVALTEVLRSAIAEVEHYSRVKLVPPIDGTVPGHAVASIIHLVAELIENATMFAPPQTQVLLRAQHVTAGVAVEVEDRGLGMQREDQERLNRLLLNPDDINLDELLRDGRIGLFVVSMIARQHGVTVQLQANIYGGTQAVIILPRQLLGSTRDDREPPAAQPALTQNTMELVQRVPGPSQIAATPPTWPAFAAEPTTTPPALIPVTAAQPASAIPPAVPTSGVPTSGVPTSAIPASAIPASTSPASTSPASGIPTPAIPTSAIPASAAPSPAGTTSGFPASAMPGSPSSAFSTPTAPLASLAPRGTTPAATPTASAAQAPAASFGSHEDAWPSHAGPGSAQTGQPSHDEPTGRRTAAEQSRAIPLGSRDNGQQPHTDSFGTRVATQRSRAIPLETRDATPQSPAEVTTPGSAGHPGERESASTLSASTLSASPYATSSGTAGAESPRRTGAEAAEGRPTVTPPPLPRRHSQTHLAPQLQFGPPPPAADDDGEHDPGLMASFMQGVSRSEAGAQPHPQPQDRPQPQPAAPDQH